MSGQEKRSNSVLLFNAGLLVVAFILSLALYKVISERLKYPDPSFYTFVSVLAVGIIVTVIFCFRPIATKLNFLLATVASLFALYLIETGLQTLHYLRLADVTFDSRYAIDVISDFRTKGQDLWSVEMPPYEYQQANVDLGKIYALSSLSDANVITCNETGLWNIIKTDKHGFNNPPIGKLEQTNDIALIGDSFAHGGCTPGNKNIGYFLRKRSHLIRNLGVMGSGPLHQLAVLSEFGPIYKPKTVLWLYFEGNDLGDLLNERRFEMLNQYKNSGFSSHIADKQEKVDKYLIHYQKTKLNQYMYKWLPRQNLGTIKKILKLEAVRRTLGLMGYQIDAHRIKANFGLVQSEFKAVAKTMKLITESWGSKLVFVYLPDGTRYDRVQRFDYWKRELISIINILNIPLWDYHEYLNNDPDPLSSYNLRRPGHFSVLGNERVANYLNIKLKLLNWSQKGFN